MRGALMAMLNPICNGASTELLRKSALQMLRHPLSCGKIFPAIRGDVVLW